LEDFFKIFEETTSLIRSFIWGPWTIALVLLTGMYFSIRLNFFQVLKIQLWFKNTFGTLFKKNINNKKNAISPFQAAATALASCVGTGNIVGVAIAITSGGPGAMFWMLVAAVFGMITMFAENILGVKYKTKNQKGEYVGGPMYYIEQGLKRRWLGCIFAFACITNSFGCANMVQSNSIAGSLYELCRIPPKIAGIIIGTLIAIVIFGGIKRIAKITESLVPFMAISYIIGGLIVILIHAKNIPSAINSIFSGILGVKPVAGGIAGYTLKEAISFGISRGVSTNEAGMGSSPIIHAATGQKEPVLQGMWGIFQVFIDTMVVCSITGLCILTTDVLKTGKEGVSLSNAAFSTVFGKYGQIFVSVSLILFALSTIIGWSYCGEKSIEFISGDRSFLVLLYKVLYSLSAMFGAVLGLDLVWKISDIFVGIMCIINLTAVLLLSKEVIHETKDYLKKIKE